MYFEYYTIEWIFERSEIPATTPCEVSSRRALTASYGQKVRKSRFSRSPWKKPMPYQYRPFGAEDVISSEHRKMASFFNSHLLRWPFGRPKKITVANTRVGNSFQGAQKKCCGRSASNWLLTPEVADFHSWIEVINLESCCLKGAKTSTFNKHSMCLLRDASASR